MSEMFVEPHGLRIHYGHTQANQTSAFFLCPLCSDFHQAAAAAWDDRMRALRYGCRSVIQCLAREKMLALPWNIDQTADALWAMLSVSVWENLTLECGWTNREYASRMKALLKRTFVK